MTAVSQTAGPETVLCGELELPFALIGFATDYANEVVPGEPTPVATLIELMGTSTAVFADVLRGAVPRLAASPPRGGWDRLPLRGMKQPGGAVLVMARSPRRGEVRRALEPVIGQDRCIALQSALIVQTVAWARAIAPDAVHIAHDPPDAAAELRRARRPRSDAVPAEWRRDRRAGWRTPPRGSSRGTPARC